MTRSLSRRQWLLTSGAAVAAGAVGSSPVVRSAEATGEERGSPFRFGLNTSTIMGQRVPVDQAAKLAAEAGYDDFEPWIRELDAYVESGQSLDDLRKRIADLGLGVPSAIGFFDWIVDDDAQRAKGLEEAKRSFDLVARIGGKRLAAPPTGATDKPMPDLRAVADRYARIVELGRSMGVIPQLEVWGFSKTLTRLSDAAFVAVDSGQEDACILADVYHLRKGGSPVEGLRLLSSTCIEHFHMNDYPSEKSPADLVDADRVFPGDGGAPLDEILRTLAGIGFRGTLSLELFNRDYWQRDPGEVVREGLAKMKAAAARAVGEGAG